MVTNVKDQMIQIIKGNGSRFGHTIYILFLSILFFIGIFLSASTYQGGIYQAQEYILPFTLSNTCISNLGNPNLNPRGWFIFSITLIIVSILLIPHVLYLNHHYHSDAPKFTTAIVVFISFSIIGLIGVAIFDENNFTYHYIFATFAFGGMGLGLFLSFFYFAYRLYQKQQWPKPTSFIIFFGIILTVCIFLISQLLQFGFADPRDLNFAEWITFFMLLFWLIGITYFPSKR
jgi:hypothetical protein